MIRRPDTVGKGGPAAHREGGGFAQALRDQLGVVAKAKRDRTCLLVDEDNRPVRKAHVNEDMVDKPVPQKFTKELRERIKKEAANADPVAVNATAIVEQSLAAFPDGTTSPAQILQHSMSRLTEIFEKAEGHSPGVGDVGFWQAS